MCELTEGTHGNAIGVGSDVITHRLFAGIDYESTYADDYASFLEQGRFRAWLDTDLHAFELGLRSCGYLEPGRERIVRILDTLHLEDIAMCRRRF